MERQREWGWLPVNKAWCRHSGGEEVLQIFGGINLLLKEEDYMVSWPAHGLCRIPPEEGG